MLKRFLRQDWPYGLLVTAALVWQASSAPVQSIEWWTYDLGMSLSGTPAPPESVRVVGIARDVLPEDQSNGALADVVTRTIRRVEAANPRVIGLVLPFEAPGDRLDSRFLQGFRDASGGHWDSDSMELLSRLAGAVPVTPSLISAIRQSKATVVATDWLPAESERANRSPPLGRAAAFAVTAIPGETEAGASGAFPSWLQPPSGIVPGWFVSPAEGLLVSADEIGFRFDTPGPTGVRSAPLLIDHGGVVLPAFELSVAARAEGRSRGDLGIRGRSGVTLGERLLATDGRYRAYPRYFKGSGLQPVSAKSVLGGRYDTSRFRDSVVLIGLDDPALLQYVDTPVGRMAPVSASAHVTASLMNGGLFAVPEWTLSIRWAAVALVSLYLMLLMPRLGVGTSVTLTVLLLVVLINSQMIVMASRDIWIPLGLPAVLLVAGHLVIGIRQLVGGRLFRFRRQLSEANRLLGQAYQAQGRLDQALERYRECLPGDALKDQIYNLGLDFERRRKFTQAAQCFQKLKKMAPDYGDVDERIHRLRSLESKVVLGNTRTAPFLLTDNSVQKPMLGRYVVEKEIGRGAMGVVYQGRDPKIGRTVAIKTMALAEEFEGQELEQVTERFFREAETAGRLSHPNIVTIYDAGEEQDLAYIAMDYLAGASLQSYCTPGTILPIDRVFDIVIQAAEALDYAHNMQVVHRDVKPANIIYDRRTESVKVTDFGVACLTDASKTKTGTVLGTPSYMSPEQVTGQKVDGRSDVFALGVTLYQLVRGELPFRGQPMATLMYKIANEKHPDITYLRPDLPKSLKAVIDKALEKNPDKRYQSAMNFAQALRRCRQQLNAS